MSLLNDLKWTYRFPATVRASPVDGVDKSYFVPDIPNSMQTTISWGRKANLVPSVAKFRNLGQSHIPLVVMEDLNAESGYDPTDDGDDHDAFSSSITVQYQLETLPTYPQQPSCVHVVKGRTRSARQPRSRSSHIPAFGSGSR